MKRAYFLFLLFWCGATVADAQNDHVKIAEQNSAAVVAINVIKQDGSTFTGTGFVITPEGLIATNRHVSQDSLYINITFNNGVVSGEAKEITKADNVDLALLKIQAQHLPYVTLGNSDTVRPGQTITVIGNPRRLQNTISSGLISQVRQKADGIIWHQISAPISHSSSGSPVFNADGEVVSIAFATYLGEGNQNLNFAVPVNYLKTLVKQYGYTLPEKEKAASKTSQKTSTALVEHVKKSWEILKRMLSPKKDENKLEKSN
jgi:S1-C subfamily serine protease